MNRKECIESVKNYKPYNAQEEKDKELILDFLEHKENAFYRTCLEAHMTASAWVVNEDMTKALMAYHKIYDSWSWLGGHADGEEDLLEVAIKEVKEESGIEHVYPYDKEIFSLESLTVDGHEKNGEYVSSHLHLNITYLFIADDSEELHIKEDENSGVSWFLLDEALEASNEAWFKERIYSKLNEKVKMIKERKDERNKL